MLHVGLMKSGTSFLQQVLRHNKDLLADQGVLFPSPWRRQVQAVKDVIAGSDRGGSGPWPDLVEEVNAWPGTAVISMEFLAPRTPAKARRIVESFAPATVEVVISVRDLARTIPAMWQEMVQNRGTWTWVEYLAAVEREDRSAPGPGRAFWMRQDAPGITETWQQVAGRAGVTVLTVPPPGSPPELLWERFAALVPVAGDVDLAVRANPSLGLASVLVLRELNVRIDAAEDPLTPRQYERIVKQLLAKRGLAGLPGDPRLGYDAGWVAARGDRDLARLRALAPRVAGDLAELRCAPVPGADLADVTVEHRLEAAMAALTHTVTVLARRTGSGAVEGYDPCADSARPKA